MGRKVGERKGLGISKVCGRGELSPEDIGRLKADTTRDLLDFSMVARDAARYLKGDVDLTRIVRGRAINVIELWGRATASEEASAFWASPDSSQYELIRDRYAGGAATLAHCGVVDLVRKRPDEKLGGLYSPTRREVVEVALGTLTQFAGGSVDTVIALENRPGERERRGFVY